LEFSRQNYRQHGKAQVNRRPVWRGAFWPVTFRLAACWQRELGADLDGASPPVDADPVPIARLGRYRGQQNAANALIRIKFWPAREAARPPRIGRLSADSGSTAKLETL
jgi:hypothetical protein